MSCKGGISGGKSGVSPVHVLARGAARGDKNDDGGEESAEEAASASAEVGNMRSGAALVRHGANFLGQENLCTDIRRRDVSAGFLRIGRTGPGNYS